MKTSGLLWSITATHIGYDRKKLEQACSGLRRHPQNCGKVSDDREMMAEAGAEGVE
jgi:hypothetical protein